MSFYTKYQELGLRDQDLISWLEFNSNVADSGPNDNDWTITAGSSGSLLGTPGVAYFTDDTIQLTSGPTGSFTAFFDAEKMVNTEESCIFSCGLDGGMFALIWAPGGGFYIIIKDGSGDITYASFFKRLEVSKRCIFALSKFENTFLLCLYDPFSQTLDTEAVSVPYDLYHNGTSLILGSLSLDGVDITGDSNFKLREFAVIQDGMPGFCVLELCAEIFNNSSDPNFNFSWIGFEDKGNGFLVDIYDGAHRENANIALPFSISPEGFSLLGEEIIAETRIFINGISSSPTDLGGYITFSGADPDDIVIADFFDDSVTLDSSVIIVGSDNCVAPVGSTPVYDTMTGRVLGGYKHISSLSLSMGKDFVFPISGSLVEI